MEQGQRLQLTEKIQVLQLAMAILWNLQKERKKERWKPLHKWPVHRLDESVSSREDLGQNVSTLFFYQMMHCLMHLKHTVFSLIPKENPTVSIGSVLKWRARSHYQ
jgi:hypothetical protein